MSGAASQSISFFEAVSKRQSVREFDLKEIPSDLRDKILETANRAPSAGNLQAYRIVAVKKASVRKTLAKACWNQEYVAQAPIVLVFCAEPGSSSVKYGERGAELYCIQDATIACAYAQLAASALGLSSVWVGAISDQEAICKALGLAGKAYPVALLPIGYPAEKPERTPRRSLRDIVRFID